MIAEASGHIEQARGLLTKIEDAILFPLILLLTAVALLVFFWGALQYVINADSDQARDTGRVHMLYGIIGLLIMVSAYVILKIAAATFGIQVKV